MPDSFENRSRVRDETFRNTGSSGSGGRAKGEPNDAINPCIYVMGKAQAEQIAGG